MRKARIADQQPEPDRLTRMLVGALVAIPMVLNAIWLLPELTSGAASLNDDAFQSMLVRVADAAIAAGRSPLDFWQATLELGFPQFFYYQHFPHLFVVGLDRLSLGLIDVFTLFNLVRFVLLVGLPLTVFWSMRRMGFSLVAAGFAAAASSLLSGDARFGFEYDSYVWRGFGMYTQLWAMHLSFITLACVYRVLQRGTGYLPAVLAFSLLALSHLIYAYMMVITVGLALLIVGDLRSILPRIARLAIVGVSALAVASYLWLPLLQAPEYAGVSPYLQEWKYDSFGASTVLGWLVSGDLMDHGRLPVLTVLLGIGVVAALVRPSRPRVFAVVGFAVWLVLYFGRPTLGPIADLLPLHDGLLFHRFIGEMELFAIILIGVGGESIWRVIGAVRVRRSQDMAEVGPDPEADGWRAVPWRPMVAFVLLVVILRPAIGERADYYDENSRWMAETRAAMDSDVDLQLVLATIQQQPYGGRTYAGLRSNWGKDMTVGGHIKVTDMLTFNDMPAVSPPYQSLSLNADMVWWFQDGEQSDFNVMDVRYAIVPADFSVPAFYAPMLRTERYALYRVPTSGMAEFVAITERRSAPTQQALFAGNLAWWQSSAPAEHRFIRWDYFQPVGPASPSEACPDGRTEYERNEFDAIHLVVACPNATTLALKVTYHPNWQVTVDGKPVETFMVSPSYVGITLPAGRHQVDAQYQPTPIKLPLLVVGLVVLGAVAVLRRRLDWIPSRLPGGRPPSGAGPDHGLAAAEGALPVGPHAEAQEPEVADGAEDDLGLGAGRGAGGPWVVRDADLDDGPVGGAELDDHLGREEGAAGLDPEPLERLAAEELAGAVDVGDLEAEEDPVGEAIGAGVEGADERVGALDPEADDDVGGVGLGQAGGQAAEVGDLELAVAVGEGDEVVAGGREAGAEGGAVAEVGRVVDGADDVGVLGREGVGEVGRARPWSHRRRR